MTLTDFVQIAGGVLIGITIGEHPTQSGLLGIALMLGSLVAFGFGGRRPSRRSSE
ncbi:hypothetical protein [Pararhizobium gei]|uniref:hypothetical protein n=1 Tax=Pararhizobium gei TaxID=1395951 RepID=UPI0023DA67CD|nr:hypothetical protein [Rhizobium gei]